MLNPVYLKEVEDYVDSIWSILKNYSQIPLTSLDKIYEEEINKEEDIKSHRILFWVYQFDSSLTKESKVTFENLISNIFPPYSFVIRAGIPTEGRLDNNILSFSFNTSYNHYKKKTWISSNNLVKSIYNIPCGSSSNNDTFLVSLKSVIDEVTFAQLILEIRKMYEEASLSLYLKDAY